MGFIRVLALVSLAVLVSFPAGCAKEPSDPVAVLLNDLVEEYGGREALGGLASHKTVWELKALLRGDSGTDTRYVELPSRLRAELRYSNSTELRVLDGERGFTSFSGSPARAASPHMLGAMKLQLLRHYTPLTLLEKRDRLHMTTEGPYKVLGLHEGPLIVRWFVNPGTLRIVKVEGTMVIGELGEGGGKTMEFRTEYSDLRRVAGVLVAHKEVKYAGGFKTAVLALKEVSLRQEFDRGLFGAGDG